MPRWIPTDWCRGGARIIEEPVHRIPPWIRWWACRGSSGGDRGGSRTQPTGGQRRPQERPTGQGRPPGQARPQQPTRRSQARPTASQRRSPTLRQQVPTQRSRPIPTPTEFIPDRRGRGPTPLYTTSGRIRGKITINGNISVGSYAKVSICLVGPPSPTPITEDNKNSFTCGQGYEFASDLFNKTGNYSFDLPLGEYGVVVHEYYVNDERNYIEGTLGKIRVQTVCSGENRRTGRYYHDCIITNTQGARDITQNFTVSIAQGL